MFDIGKTADLANLVAIPSAQRDDAWRERFFDAAWNASVVRHEPALFTGPDGFPYLRLDIPKPGPFDSNSLANFAEPCLQHATGVALFASPDAPPEAAAYVFSMGLIDSLVRHDSWIGDAIDRQEATETTDPAAYATDKIGERERLSVKTERQILTGTPSPELLPPHTARAMLNHIQSQWGISDPRIALMVDPRCGQAATW